MTEEEEEEEEEEVRKATWTELFFLYTCIEYFLIWTGAESDLDGALL